MQGVDRTRRVAQAIAEELPAALREVKDPRVTGLITVHEVTVSRDLGIAKVRFDVLGGADADGRGRRTAPRAGFLRSGWRGPAPAAHAGTAFRARPAVAHGRPAAARRTRRVRRLRRRRGRPVSGVLLLDKPRRVIEPGSADRAAFVRAAKAGHTGTLDPLATGRAAAVFWRGDQGVAASCSARDKTTARARLGITTSTGDSEGGCCASGRWRWTRRPLSCGARPITGDADAGAVDVRRAQARR